MQGGSPNSKVWNQNASPIQFYYPVSLARDLAGPARLGLPTVAINPYDMLPHTPHVVTLALVLDG